MARAFIACGFNLNAIFTPFERQVGDSLCSTMYCLSPMALISESSYESSYHFLGTELRADTRTPTVLCGHIPSVSVLPNLSVCGETKTNGLNIETPASLLAHNASDLHRLLKETGANVKLILAGHLHHLEQIQIDGSLLYQWRRDLRELVEGNTYGLPGGLSGARSGQRRPSRGRL